MEREFAEFNRDQGYAAHVARSGKWDGPAAVPHWQNTRRYKKKMSKNPLKRVARAVPRLFGHRSE